MRKRTETQSHQFQLNQGINRFQIHAEDARGNKSNKNLVDTMVDTLPANPPKISVLMESVQSHCGKNFGSLSEQ